MTTHGASDPLYLHGGDLAAARQRFPDAPEPWLDLSTGLSPYPYPIPELSPEVWRRLPDPGSIERLEGAARRAYGVADGIEVVAVPGSQAAASRLPALLPAGDDVRILGPTYGGHHAAWMAAGRTAREVRTVGALAGADIAVLVNPNNPDGRLIGRSALQHIAASTGVTVVDEAYMDLLPPGSGLLPGALPDSVVVLRSFGKTYGLAGLRLGFAVLDRARAGRLRALLGPWPVSGPAVAIGEAALSDPGWLIAARVRLAEMGRQLDATLGDAGLTAVGGTPLFRLVESPFAAALFEALGRNGILVRPFAGSTRLRLGLPADAAGLARLAAALAAGSGLDR